MLARLAEIATALLGVLCFLDLPPALFDAIWAGARDLPRAVVTIAPDHELLAQQWVGGFLVISSLLTLSISSWRGRRAQE